jgi:hypothetical protein
MSRKTYETLRDSIPHLPVYEIEETPEHTKRSQQPEGNRRMPFTPGASGHVEVMPKYLTLAWVYLE